MREVLQLTGYESIRGFYAYHKLMLGLNMLPSYIKENYRSFYTRISALPESDKIAILKEAAIFVELEKHEVEALCYFCTDKNGIRYTSVNMKSLSPVELVDIIHSVCFEMSKLDIDLLSEEEKKNSLSSQSI